MKVDIRSIYYRNSGKAKTIKSNGSLITGDVYFDEEDSISLLDDFAASGKLQHNVGTWTTDNHKVTLGSGYF
ncbi:hypothetical protein, partial [Paraburkholderia sp. SIMBA_030]